MKEARHALVPTRSGVVGYKQDTILSIQHNVAYDGYVYMMDPMEFYRVIRAAGEA